MARPIALIRSRTTGVIAALAVLSGLSPLPSRAQSAPDLTSIDIPPTVLAEIREAPFSEVFTLADGKAYAVKDQDYSPVEPKIGLFTLWANVPEEERLGVAVKYCFADLELANAGAELVAMTLLDDETELVTIDQVVETRPAYLNEVRPPQTSPVRTSFYYDPFYAPFYYSPFSVGVSYAPSTYIAGVECSMGLTLFNLTAVQAELAALPEQTLRVRLLFSNGATEYWDLGGGTVRALKQLPTLAALQ